jgi:hypothetical protein
MRLILGSHFHLHGTSSPKPTAKAGMTGSVGPENEPASRQQAARWAPSCESRSLRQWRASAAIRFNGRERRSAATVNSWAVVLRFLHGHARTRELAAQLARLHCRRLLPCLEREDVGRLRESTVPGCPRCGGIEGLRHRQQRTASRVEQGDRHVVAPECATIHTRRFDQRLEAKCRGSFPPSCRSCRGGRAIRGCCV